MFSTSHIIVQGSNLYAMHGRHSRIPGQDGPPARSIVLWPRRNCQNTFANIGMLCNLILRVSLRRGCRSEEMETCATASQLSPMTSKSNVRLRKHVAYPTSPMRPFKDMLNRLSPLWPSPPDQIGLIWNGPPLTPLGHCINGEHHNVTTMYCFPSGPNGPVRPFLVPLPATIGLSHFSFSCSRVVKLPPSSTDARILERSFGNSKIFLVQCCKLPGLKIQTLNL